VKRRPPLPQVPPSVQPDLRAYLTAQRDVLEVAVFGVGGSTRRSVTFDDLIALGLITPAQAEARAKVQA